MKTLFKEIRAQFTLSEWIDAMKQAIKELFNQWSIKEWVYAFFVYVPTANGVRPKVGARLVYPGGTSEEIYNDLKLMKHGNN
jgi:hypothetical protein